MPEPLRIGLAGLGTVGAGVVKMLQAHGETIAARAGRPLAIAAVSARSRHRDRGVDLAAYAWEDDPVALARREDVDLVVEVMGGEDGPARATALAAIAGGKHLVTANKAMLARHGQALAEAAEAAGVALRFEAAVAGGIPVIKALTEGLAGNAITRLIGVLNGTCNYILTRMEAEDAPYAVVLEAAQRLGYAEADPAFDVGGTDAAQKLALLAATAFGTQVDLDGIAVEGIERVSLADIEHAAELGYRIRLLGVARMTEKGLEARMQPCLVPAASPPGQLQGVTNMVVIEGDFVGRIVMSGPGAGEGPTASAIVGDVIDIARGLVIPPFGRPAASLAAPARAGDGAAAAYYLRFLLTDAPGALARVAAALGDAGISINRMRQVEHAGAEAPVLIVTHRAERAALDRALGAIAGLEVCRAAPVAIRIEEILMAELRRARDADTAAIQAIYAHHVLHGLATFEEAPPDAAEMAARRADVLARGLPYLVAEEAGRILGYAYAAPYRARSAYRFTVEDSIYLDPAATGRGLGARLLAALIEASTAAGARQMLAVIGDSGNAASIAVHARAGFAHAGCFRSVGFKFGRWVDTVMMQRPLGPGDGTLA